jgi:PAS domain S-box-containing protein
MASRRPARGSEVPDRSSSDRFRQFAEGVPDWAWEVDRDGVYTYVGPGVRQLLGYEPEEVLGRTPFDLMPTGEAERVRAEFERFVEAGEPFSGLRNVNLLKGGGEVVLETNGVPIHDHHGRLIGFRGFDRDVTVQARTERALRESQKMFQTVLDAIPVRVFWKDRDLNYLGCNRPFARDAGMNAPEDLIGKNDYDMSWKEQADLYRGDDRSVIESGESKINYEEPQTWPDGTRLWLRTSKVPLRDADGEIIGVFGCYEDITERKEEEEERLRLEARILHGQKLESLGVLAGGIAHDFNNLLTGVLGNVGMAARQLTETSPARPYLDDVEKSALRAADLCRQMLAYSGKGRFLVQPLDLSVIVEEMTQLLKVSIAKNAALQCRLARNLPSIEADPAQVRQVVMNLITNASDAIGDGNGVITVATGSMECDREYLDQSYLDDDLQEGRYVFAEVTDTGCGMDPETVDRLFDPFFTTKFTGRGLGMAAVLGILRGHRGAIKVYSEPGHGSSIKVLFPASSRTAESVPVSPPSAEGWTGTGTVLVVDDEDSVRTLARNVLESAGFTVVLAAHGREALDLFRLRGEEIVAVVLDLTMPEMGGEETFRELRRIRTDVPVLLSSGYNEQDVTSRFAGKGLAAFVQKPYRPEDLLGKLREVLEK